MSIVRLALRCPYAFAVVAVPIAVVGIVSIVAMRTAVLTLAICSLFLFYSLTRGGRILGACGLKS
jgi:hypothetical protein